MLVDFSTTERSAVQSQEKWRWRSTKTVALLFCSVAQSNFKLESPPWSAYLHKLANDHAAALKGTGWKASTYGIFRISMVTDSLSNIAVWVKLFEGVLHEDEFWSTRTVGEGGSTAQINRWDMSIATTCMSPSCTHSEILALFLYTWLGLPATFALSGWHVLSPKLWRLCSPVCSD